VETNVYTLHVTSRLVMTSIHLRARKTRCTMSAWWKSEQENGKTSPL